MFDDILTLYFSIKLASAWFGEEERTVATSIGALAPLIGMAAAYALGPNVVKVCT